MGMADTVRQEVATAVQDGVRSFEHRMQELELQSSLFKEAALQLPGVVSRLESLQTAVHQQQQQHSAVASQAEVEGLRAQLKAMQRTVTSLTEELHSQAAGKAGVTGKQVEDAVQAAEKKMADRQQRLEGAIVQVASRVDTLDAHLRQEQETSIKALEAILADRTVPAS